MWVYMDKSAHVWVRRSTVLFPTFRAPGCDLQPCHRYSCPFCTPSNSKLARERRLAQQHSTSTSEPSISISPRTQNKRQSPDRKKHIEITYTHAIIVNHKRGLLNISHCYLWVLPMFSELSSLEPRWMTSPPWKSWRKQGGSFPCVTSTCAPLWLPSSTVMRADVPRPLTLEWHPCQKKHAVRSLPGPAVLISPGFCLLPTANTKIKIFSTLFSFYWILHFSQLIYLLESELNFLLADLFSS